MTALADIVLQITEAKAAVNALTPKLQSALTDNTIPLDDRWKAYCDAVDESIITRNETYGNGFIEILYGSRARGSLYDDFYIEKYQTSEFKELLERVEEDREDFDQVTDENIVAWKEKVLASGYASFTYDW